jgi:hypothetical protein
MKNNTQKSFEDYKKQLNEKYTTKLKVVKESSEEENNLIKKHQQAKRSLICRFFNL